MKKNLLTVFLVFLLSNCVWAQVQSIQPNNAFQGQTLTTTITMAAGSFSSASPPMGQTDIYLQQGGTTIFTYAGYNTGNVYWPYDSLWTEFTIPANAPNGYYDVNVVTYVGFNPIVNTLPNGFFVGEWAGTLEGDIYFDTNQNGAWDGGEPPLQNHKVEINPGNFIIYTNAAGHYKAYMDTGTYTISYLPNISFFQTSLPVTYNATVPPSSTGYDFGVFSLQSYYNQYFYIWPNQMRCAPNMGYTYVKATNNGMIPVQGSITMIHSSNTSLNAAVPPPDVVNGDTLTWYYTSLGVGQTFQIGGPWGPNWMAFNMPAAGQLVWFSVIDSVFDMSGNVMTQYTDSFASITICSFDPNDKWASPAGTGAQNYTQPNTDFTYTINFQNTGNDTAFTVIITDSLDVSLDWNTFEVISSSHPVFAQMDPNGIVTFTFQNIMLPDSNVDEPGSHGHVGYRIRTDSLLPDPIVISNTAYIYFDWNDPVITNTTINTITALQFPAAAFSTSDVAFCPGYCVDFTNLSTSGAAYQWNFPGGNPTSSTDTDPANICYTVSGTYDVELIVTNALGTDTAVYSNYIEVFNVSPQAIIQSGDTLFANPGFVTYVWYYNGNIIAGASDYFYVASQNGDYNVISWDSNGCDVEAAIYNVMTDVGTTDLQDEVDVYPNPVYETLEITGKIQGPVLIFNVLGEIVLHVTKDDLDAGPVTRIDVSMLPPGTYTLELKTGEHTIHKQIVKQ